MHVHYVSGPIFCGKICKLVVELFDTCKRMLILYMNMTYLELYSWLSLGLAIPFLYFAIYLCSYASWNFSFVLFRSALGSFKRRVAYANTNFDCILFHDFCYNLITRCFWYSIHSTKAYSLKSTTLVHYELVAQFKLCSLNTNPTWCTWNLKLATK